MARSYISKIGIFGNLVRNLETRQVMSNLFLILYLLIDTIDPSGKYCVVIPIVVLEISRGDVFTSQMPLSCLKRQMPSIVNIRN